MRVSQPEPVAIREKAFDIAWKDLLCWDAMDNALQGLRFSLLLLHVHSRLPAPKSRLDAAMNPTGYLVMRLLSPRSRISLRRGLLVATEGVANARRLALLGLWLYTFMKEFSERWHQHKRCASQSVQEKERRVSIRIDSEEDHASETRNAVDDLDEFTPLSFVDAISMTGEFVAHLGESFDVASFLHGSGLFWSAFGIKNISELPPWLQRRRRGLERVGTYVSLLALVIQLYAAHRRRKSITRSMMYQVQTMEREMRRIDEDRSSAQKLVPHARQRVEHAYSMLLAERRRFRWLGVERMCLYGDTAFALTEIWAPDRDNELLEASTGLFAAVLRMLRLWNEIRFGALDI